MDRRHELGGQITAIYPEKWVYDIPGIPSIRGRDLFHNQLKQIEHYNIPISLNEEIVNISKNRNNILRLESRNGNIHHAKTVILCLGMGAHMPRRHDIPNLKNFDGKGIFYGVYNLDDFRNKRVMVVGGGDSALDLALTIVNDCKDLIVAHRSDRFNAHEETVKKLYSSNAEVRLFNELVGLQGGARLTHAVLKENRVNQTETIEIDALIIAIGLIFNLEGVKEWGIELENNAIVVDHNRMTSIPGVYAAGDIATYPGKMKLIATGAAEAMEAIHHAKHYIQEKFPYL